MSQKLRIFDQLLIVFAILGSLIITASYLFNINKMFFDGAAILATCFAYHQFIRKPLINKQIEPIKLEIETYLKQTCSGKLISVNREGYKVIKDIALKSNINLFMIDIHSLYKNFLKNKEVKI